MYKRIACWDRYSIRRDRDSHYRDTFTFKLEKVYKFRKNKPKLNKFGIEEKEIYRTSDVCKLLNVTSDTLRLRLYRGIWKDNFKKDGVGRKFTVDDLAKLIEMNGI